MMHLLQTAAHKMAAFTNLFLWLWKLRLLTNRSNIKWNTCCVSLALGFHSYGQDLWCSFTLDPSHRIQVYPQLFFCPSHFTSGITKDWDKANWRSWGSCWWGGCASMHAWPSSWSSQCSADCFHAEGCAAVPPVPVSHASHHLDRHIRYPLFMSPDSQTDICTDTLGTIHSCHQIRKQICV